MKDSGRAEQTTRVKSAGSSRSRISAKPLRKTREKARADSLVRIASAARHLFIRIGYDGTTLRMIADRSDMALGTLFYYIRDKRDLIYLLFNDEFDAATNEGLAKCLPLEGFEDKVMAMTEPFYRFFAREPELSRILLNEVQQHSPGFHLARNLEIRGRFICALEQLVRDAQASGEMKYIEDPNIIALSIFFCFGAAVRWWIETENPKWRAGHKSFARFFQVIARGLLQPAAPPLPQEPRPTAPRRSKSR